MNEVIEFPALSATAVLWRFALVLLLVAANGFFVAAEFSLVGARRTRIEALARAGNRRAKFAQHAIKHLDHYISGTQLGITLSSLALGWLGETTVAGFLIQVFHGLPGPWDAIATHAVAGTIAFAFITFLHIVLGELAPKSVALLFPETTSLWTAAPLIGFSRLFAPFIRLLNGAANLLLRLFGLKAPSEMERVHRPEEIELLAVHAYEHGGLSEEPLDMIRGVFDLSERTVADVMTPRTRMVAIPIATSVEEAVDTILESGFTRVPVYTETLDDIKGMVAGRDVWRAFRSGERRLAELVRSFPYVPTTKDLETLLVEMRDGRHHLAVAVDEFGGTAGIVSIEDILEEIVGDIHDEHEVEPASIREHEGEIHLRGTVSLYELNDTYALDLPAHEFATISGLVMDRLGRIAEVGDEIGVKGGKVRVAQLSGRRIERLVLVLGEDE